MSDLSLLELPSQIALALSLASSTTGTDLDFLMKTAERESSFQADAKAATSSAEGLFQFIEETWIRTIKDEGEKYGLGDYAALIEKREDGRYVVAEPKHRRAILALRRDPQISAVMAGAYAARNAEMIAEEIGRRPTSAELYIAHFLGPSDAIRLIRLRDTKPFLSAPDVFPKAADANGRIFYGQGRPRSVGEVYDVLVSRHERSLRRSTASARTGGVDAGFGSWDPRVQQVVYLSGGSDLQGHDIIHPRASGSDRLSSSGTWQTKVDEAAAGEVIASMPVAVTASRMAAPAAAAEVAEAEPAAALLRGTDGGAEQGVRRISVAEALAAKASSSSLKIIKVSP